MVDTSKDFLLALNPFQYVRLKPDTIQKINEMSVEVVACPDPALIPIGYGTLYPMPAIREYLGCL